VVDLWRAFGKYGRIGEVYVPNKVDIRGCRFGFVKFKEVTNVTEFSKKLENVWFGTYKLRINLARFGREGIRGVQAANMGDLGRSSTMGKTFVPSDERCYDAPIVFYIFQCCFSLFPSSFSLLCFPLLSSTSQSHPLYFLQTNYYTQVYQFNLLLISFKLARKTKTLKEFDVFIWVRSEV
jgi:RNA recognition motif-containing protein